MDSSPYPRLLSPLPIGPVTSRNRVVFGAHFTMMGEPNPVWGEPGYYGARQGRYAADRAAGGAGVIIIGHAHVHPTTAYSMRNNAIAWLPEAIPHYREVTTPIRDNGALAFIQLSHSGAKSNADWTKAALLAPSRNAINTEAPKVMELHEIADVIEHFAISAEYAAEGGFQGIELHGAHLYLINEFMSPNTNQRDDEYGGSFENRMRFAVEVLEAVRSRVGPEIAVGMRLVGDELAADGSGITPKGAAEIAVYLEERGLVDFLNVSVGNVGAMVQPMYFPHLLGVYAANEVKAAVGSTPVFTVHRILTPDEAEGILERDEADAITMVRALIADPDWVAKAAAGRADTIRRCVGCNQLCYGNLYRSLSIQCVTNPAVGRESELGSGTLTAAATPLRVMVVGGGPGGLEAAWVAAARGHSVTLFERSSALGGKIRLAQRLPGREEIANFVDWRIDECQRRGVEIRLDTSVDLALVQQFDPDALIVATGGRPSVDLSGRGQVPVYGLDDPMVIDHEVATAYPERVGERVLIVDAIGHIEGAGLAELFVAAGRTVTLASPLMTLVLLDTATAASALRRACRAGAVWRANTVLRGLRDGVATLVDTLSGLESTLAVDTVVVRAHGDPIDDLYHRARADGRAVWRIGDAVAVRPADRAIHEGHRVGRLV